MKKLLAIALVLIMALTMLVGCGNQSLGFGKFTFRKIHVDTYHYSGCFTVEKWHGYESGVEVKTKEAGSMFLADGMYVLINDKCPFCAG